jgi:acyl-ACP thioesterase
MSRRFEVRAYESDPNGWLRPGSLLNYFQEAAGDHADRLGAGVMEVIKRNLAWVLSRYHIRLIRYPRWKELVLLTTWPCSNQGLFALREFELRDSGGSLLAAASSSWMLIDLRTKRPVAPGERLGPYPQDPRRAVDSAFERLPTVIEADFERTFRVRMGELDWNRHVNHVAYVAWALETGSREFLENHRPAEIEADFRGAAHYGDTVVCRMQSITQGQAPVSVYQIAEGETRRELARLRIAWLA